MTSLRRRLATPRVAESPVVRLRGFSQRNLRQHFVRHRCASLRLFLVALVLVAAFPTVVRAGATLYAFGTAAGDATVARSDDDSAALSWAGTGPAGSTPVLTFNRSSYKGLFVNNNGNVSFGASVAVYIQTAYQGASVIAPLWADVDTRPNSASVTRLVDPGSVYYRTTQDTSVLTAIGAQIRGSFAGASGFVPTTAQIVTWDHVAGYGLNDTNATTGALRNTFQLVLATDGFSTYSTFLYPDNGLQWLTTPTNTGRPYPAVGFQPGLDNFFDATASGTAATANLPALSNTVPSSPGTLIYRIDNQTVTASPSSPVADPVGDVPVVTHRWVSANGDGNWAVATTNWVGNSSSPTAIATDTTAATWVNSHGAIFGGTAGIVNITAPVSTLRMSLETTGYTFTSTLAENSLQLGQLLVPTANTTVNFAGNLVVLVDRNAIATNNGAYLGAITQGNLVFKDNSVLVARGTGSIVGGTIALQAGAQLQLYGDAPTTRGVSLVFDRATAGGSTGGTFDLHGYSTTVGAISSLGTAAGVIKNSAATASTLTVDFDTAASTFNGVIQDGTGTLALAKSGTGTLTLTGANTYTGGTTIAAGTLSIGDGGSTGSLAGNIANHAALVFNRSANLDYAGVISGAGTLTKLGSGTLILRGDNTITGAITLAAGTLGLASDTALGRGTATLTLAGGEIRAEGSARTVANALVLAGSFTLGRSTYFTGDGTLTRNVTITSANPDGQPATSSSSFSGNLSGSFGLSFAEGANPTGTIALNGNNTYTGGTTLLGGILSIGNSHALGTGPLTLGGSAGTLKTNGFNLTVSGLDGSGSLANTGAATLTVNGGGDYSGVLSGDGSLVKTGTSTLTLSGTNTYTGGTTLAAGHLTVAGDASLGATTGALTFDGGTLQLLAAVNTTRPVALASGGGTLENNGYNFTVTTLTGTGALTKSGTGNLVLSGSSVFEGSLAITGGSAVISAGTTLQIGNNNAAGSIAGSLVNNGTLVFQRSDTVTLTSAISGSGSLVKNGANALIVDHAGTYASATTVNAGTLQFGSGGSIGTISATIANSASVAFNHGNAATFSGILRGAGSLTKSGSGNLSVTSANTFTGGTTLLGGTLSIGNNSAFGTGSLTLAGGEIRAVGAARTVANSVVLGGDFSLGRLTNFSGPITLAKNIVITSTNPDSSGATTSTFSGNLSGAFGLTFAIGANPIGTIALTGNNTYTGGTTLLGGTLSAGNSHALGTGALTLSGGALQLASNSALAFDNHVTVAGNTTLVSDRTSSGAGVTHTLGTLSIGAQTLTTTRGSLATSGTGGLAFGAATLTGNATFATNTATQLTLASVSETGGARSLTKSGAGTLVITGDATHTGGTTISVGTLQLGNGGTTGTLAGDVLNNGTLAFNRANTLAFAGNITGAGTLAKLGTGTLTLSGTNTYSGTTTVSAGRLVVNGAAANSAFTVNSGGTLGGHGSIGALTLASGSTLSPGNSPGTLHAGDTTIAGDTTFHFEVNNATGTPGTNYDLLAIFGSLTLTATSANPFLIDVTSLKLLDNTAGLAANFDLVANYSFTFLTTTGGITGFSADAFAIDTTGFTNPFTGTWSVSLTNSGHDLALNYAGVASAVPEPSTYTALAGAFALAAAAWHRRRARA